MKRLFGICLSFAIAVAFGMTAQPSAAKSHHAQCPYGSGYADGCSKASAGGSFINSAFFASAKQSGQGSYYSSAGNPSDHPPPWNVAGVDYPVGYSTSRRLKDPAVDQLPAGCSYSATGSDSGGPVVTCGHTANLELVGWDFSLHNCTVLDIQNSTTGKIVVKDSKFVNGPNCSHTNGYLVTVESPAPASFAFKHNLVDGDALNYPTSLIAMVWPNNTGTVSIKYNAFLHSPARPIAIGWGGSLLVAYNYWEGFGYHDSDGHGEVIINSFGNTTQQSASYSYNTVLEPNNACSGCATAAFYASSGQYGGEIMETQVDHNTSVINLNAQDHGVIAAAASAETSYDTYGNVLFQQNYIDPTGAYYDFISTGNETFLTTPVFDGNVNMLNGGNISGFNTK